MGVQFPLPANQFFNLLSTFYSIIPNSYFTSYIQVVAEATMKDTQIFVWVVRAIYVEAHGSMNYFHANLPHFVDKPDRILKHSIGFHIFFDLSKIINPKIGSLRHHLLV